MFCIHCGKEIPDESKFCQYCGNALEQVTAPEQRNEPFPDTQQLHQTQPQTIQPNVVQPSSNQNQMQEHLNRGIVCPRCGSSDLKIERFTWWGGILGATFANRMVCKKCGNKFKINK